METNKHMKSSAHFYFEMVLYLIHHERKKGCLVFLLENNIYSSDKKTNISSIYTFCPSLPEK